MYYQSSENKGADQLRGYCEADLRLCFRICQKPVFSRRGSYSKTGVTAVYIIFPNFSPNIDCRYLLEPYCGGSMGKVNE